MSAAAALLVLALQAGPPAWPEAPASPPPAPPTIDSLLEQAPMSEDERSAAVRAAYGAAEARRGGLDGRWRLTDARGQALYIFQISDPGGAPDPRSSNPRVPVIEGAWRDPRREGTRHDAGFLSSVQRDGAGLVVRFVDRDPSRPQVVTLRPRAGGDWTGEIAGEAAAKAVVMSRF
jgi:hypothetical protein